jgi:hypothetical protein
MHPEQLVARGEIRELVGDLHRSAGPTTSASREARVMDAVGNSSAVTFASASGLR